MKSELDGTLSLLFHQLKYLFHQSRLLFAFYLVISLDNWQTGEVAYMHTQKSGGIRDVEVPNT